MKGFSWWWWCKVARSSQERGANSRLHKSSHLPFLGLVPPIAHPSLPYLTISDREPFFPCEKTTQRSSDGPHQRSFEKLGPTHGIALITGTPLIDISTVSPLIAIDIFYDERALQRAQCFSTEFPKARGECSDSVLSISIYDPA